MLKDQLLKLQEILQGGFFLLKWSRHSHTFNGQLSRSSSQPGMQGLVIKGLGVNCSPGLGNHGNYALGAELSHVSWGHAGPERWYHGWGKEQAGGED